MILHLSERALILAPRGRDAAVAAAMLAEAGLRPAPCPGLPALVAGLAAGAGLAVVTEEALRDHDLHPLAGWIGAQPEWSDFPFVLLTERGGGLERNPAARRWLDTLGNVTFLERPFHPTSLVSLAESALRGRRRQYEARARLETLRAAEDHYRHTVELNPQVTWTATPDGMLDHVVPRWHDWTGTTGLGATWGDAMHPDDLGPSLAAWGRSVATGEPYDVLHRMRMRDGAFRWIHSRAHPRRDGQGDGEGDGGGAILKWYGTTEDVHDRLEAEAGLRAAEARARAQAEELRGVLDAVPAGIWITRDPEARVIVGNARSHELLRVAQGGNQSKSGDEAATAHFRFLDEAGAEVAPRDLPVQRAARGEAVQGQEYRVAFNDGGHVDIFGNARPLRDGRGRITGSVAAFMDITARKAMEGALREETRVLETVSRAGSALAAELDLGRLLQDLTDAGVALTGARYGAYFENVWDDDSGRLRLFTLSGAAPSDFEGMGGVRATGVFGPTFRNEGVVRSEDILADPRYGHLGPHHGMPAGHLPVRSYLGVSVVARGGEVLGGLLFGHPEPGRFTARHERVMTGLAAQAAVAIDNARLFREAEAARETLEDRVAERTQALREAQEALQQAQKMEAVGQLTGGIAHDFNNLLQGVQGSLELIRRKAHDGARVARLAEAGLEAAQRGAKLTAQLLAFSRAQRIESRPVLVAALAAGMRDLLERTLGPSLRVRLDLAPDDGPVLSDPTQLEMAVLNLAINARDASPEGGRLTVSTRNLRLRADPGLPDGDYVELAVADEGAGMPPEVAARAFDPFFTTKGVGKGTGLGLSQVYGIARQAGGAARIETAPGRGTTVRLLLPRTDAAPVPEAPEAPAVALEATPARVLVVDDDDGVRRFLVESLGVLGYRVAEAADGPQGLARLAEAAPDLLLVDFAMPGMTGAEVARAARARHPDLPVVFATGFADTAAIEGVEGPAVRVLRKPFRVDELRATLAQALRAGG